MESKKFKRIESIIYIAIWALIVIACTLHFSGEKNDYGTFISSSAFLRTVIYIFPLLLIFIINNYILIPRLIQNNDIFKYSIYVTLILIIIGFYQYEEFFINQPPNHCPPSQPVDSSGIITRKHFLPPPLLHTFIYDIFVIGLNLAVWSVSRQVAFKIENSQLVEANTRSQLDQLKAQINPHFYMNMLNSIHGLVDINPEKAKDLIIEMSHLMDYMLYESAHQKISLAREIVFLKDYIHIIHDRYPVGKVNISVSFPKESEIEHIMIPPLLFIAFIENAFKHGVDYRYVSDISISLELKSNYINFVCINSVHPKDSNVIKRGGIGLENIKKRLALIYQGNSELIITKSDTDYIVNLTLPIDET